MFAKCLIFRLLSVESCTPSEEPTSLYNSFDELSISEFICSMSLLFESISCFKIAMSEEDLLISAANNHSFFSSGFKRKSAFIAKGVVLMPSFVNLGAYVDEGTMIDTWATVGSCAQIGKNCHISGGAGIGGVLEPLQAGPVIIEDNCFVGARSEIAEGVLVEEGAVISMGVYIGASTKIIDRATGEITYGKVPAYSVVVPGSLPNKSNPDRPSLYCAVIVKKVDSKTRSKTSINDLLRD